LSAGEVVDVNPTFVTVWTLLAVNTLWAGVHLKKEAETVSQSVTHNSAVCCMFRLLETSSSGS